MCIGDQLQVLACSVMAADSGADTSLCREELQALRSAGSSNCGEVSPGVSDGGSGAASRNCFVERSCLERLDFFFKGRSSRGRSKPGDAGGKCPLGELKVQMPLIANKDVAVLQGAG